MNSERIYEHAAKDLGLKETPGAKSTPRIKTAIKHAADWLDGDDSVTPWCGAIRGLWALETGTGAPPEHYRARSWLEWGHAVRLQDAQKGDTVVFKRSGGYHVALFDRAAGEKIYVLGGNQSNAVNVQGYAKEDVMGVRRG